MLSLLMQGQPIFSSAHVWTGLAGLACLSLNGMLSLFFEEEEGARTAVSGSDVHNLSLLWPIKMPTSPDCINGFRCEIAVCFPPSQMAFFLSCPVLRISGL